MTAVEQMHTDMGQSSGILAGYAGFPKHCYKSRRRHGLWDEIPGEVQTSNLKKGNNLVSSGVAT